MERPLPGIQAWVPPEVLPDNIQSRLAQAAPIPSVSLESLNGDEDEEVDDAQGGGGDQANER